MYEEQGLGRNFFVFLGGGEINYCLHIETSRGGGIQKNTENVW